MPASTLQDPDHRALEVVNAGRKGHTTGEMLARIPTDVIPHGPDTVILLAGTNDCCNSGKLCDPEVVERNYRAILAGMPAGCRLLLVTPPVFHAPYLATRHSAAAYGDLPPEARLRLARQALLRMAAAHRLPLVDLHAISAGCWLAGEDPRSWLKNPGNSGLTDGVHPTSDGYRSIAGAIAAVLIQRIPDARRIVCLGDSITYGQEVAGEGTATGETYPAWLRRILAACDARDGIGG